jgi:hypothetical protein
MCYFAPISYPPTDISHHVFSLLFAAGSAEQLKGLSETSSKINEAVDYFVTMIPSVIILPSMNMEYKMCCHAIKKFYKKKIIMQAETERSLQNTSYSGRDQNFRQVLPVVSKYACMHAHAPTHTKYRISVRYTLKGKSDRELQVVIW